MLLESETLLENRNPSSKTLLSGNEFITPSRRKRFRPVGVVVIMCFLGYLFLVENNQLGPIGFDKPRPVMPVQLQTGNSKRVANSPTIEFKTLQGPSSAQRDILRRQTSNLETTENVSMKDLDQTTSAPVETTELDIETTAQNIVETNTFAVDEQTSLQSDQTTDKISVTTVFTEAKLENKNETADFHQTENPTDNPSSSTPANSITISPEQACKIPKLDPFHPSLKKALKEAVKKPLCGTKFPLMFGTDLHSNLIQVQEPKSVKWGNCCYRVITRAVNGTPSDNKESSSSQCFNITRKQTKIPQDHEFIGIYCTPDKDNNNTNNANEQMVDGFAFTPLKPEVEKRINKTKSLKDYKSKEQVNVVIFGIDAVSHMNFQRVMPKVYKYLLTDLDAISMNGYTKMGDNTFPNMIAALTSWNATEIKEKCEKNRFFDDCPFLWKNFSQEGYRTAYGEDCTWMGIFNYLKNGFRNPPTDYYFRPLARAMGNLVSYDKRGNAKICYGPRMTFDVLLNYLKQLANTMGHDKRYFQFVWSTALTHDFVNQGKLGEASLLSTLKWFKASGHFNNTVFILMSDHGIRWGPVRELKQGKIEENMPFLYFVIPEWFKSKYKIALDNLRANENLLTSPYDTFETLKDLLYLDTISDKGLELRQKDPFTETEIPRGISLFLPVPNFRTCQMAGIAEHYCVCHTSKSLSTEDPEVRQAASFAVYTLNSFVAAYATCAYLALNSVTRAQMNFSKDKKLNGGAKIFELAFITDPGKGLFEATVVKNATGNWAMSGTISRTNLYGNQSHCISDKEMKKICYCIDV